MNIYLIAGAIVALLLSGCAPKMEKPTAEIARAATLIEQAEKSGGQRYAAAELQQAHEKLTAADAAAEKNHNDVAHRLAAEASVDAELAVAKTSNGQAQSSAGEVKKSTEALQEEAQRNSTTTTP